jgi:hypothetical protein
MKNGIKYIMAAAIAGAVVGTAYYYPAELFMAFIAGWVFGIPVAVVVYMVYGLVISMKDRKNRIIVTVKPTEAMKAIARREEELKREKERIMYEEVEKGNVR